MITIPKLKGASALPPVSPQFLQMAAAVQSQLGAAAGAKQKQLGKSKDPLDGDAPLPGA